MLDAETPTTQGPREQLGRSAPPIKPFQHLRSVPREQAEAALGHLLDEPIKEPSPEVAVGAKLDRADQDGVEADLTQLPD